MSDDERTEAMQFGSSNEAALLNQNFMQLRLDTRPLIADIDLFLSAKRKVVKEAQNGQLFEAFEDIGSPLANPAGINNLLNIIQLSANQHIVQGNTDKNDYLDIIADCRKELTEQIVINCYEWGIEDRNINLIIDNLMRFLRLFLSRTVENLERLSYQQQFASREIVHQGKKAGALQNFADGINTGR